MFQSYLSDILHVVAQWLLVPDIILLLLFIGYALFCIGSVLAEYFTERRHFQVVMPKFLDDLTNASEAGIPDVVNGSGLLKHQKDSLLTVYEYRKLPGDALLALMKRQMSEEEARYGKTVSRNNTAARVAPMLGLMGTLIPLGPGIEALGRADTAALSSSLLVAFDTTVAGLVVAAVCLVVGKIRSSWYEDYLSALDAAMATMLEKIEGLKQEAPGGSANAADANSKFEKMLEFEPMPEFKPKTQPVFDEAPVVKRESQARFAYEPAAEPAYEPQTKPAAEPAAEPAVEPLHEPVVEPQVEAPAEVAFEPQVELPVEPIYEPQIEPVYEPLPKPAYDPQVDSAYKPELAPEFVLDPDPKPAASSAVATRSDAQPEPEPAASAQAADAQLQEPVANRPADVLKKKPNLMFEPKKIPLEDDPAAWR